MRVIAPRVFLLLILMIHSRIARAEAPVVGFKPSPGKVAIFIEGQPFAAYVYEDKEISRPYFAHVRAPGGVQVTRNHPPIEGRDLTDHPTFHPGVWLAFGDISGSDYWRLKAPVRHVEFIQEPSEGNSRGAFTVRNRYLDQEDNSKTVCEEENAIAIHARPAGYLIEWDSTFSSDRDFYFGDQEEMGLGFRIASPMYVKPKGDEDLPSGTGRILDAMGRRNESEVWSQSAKWCDFSGMIDDAPAGITIFCHPANLRPSWYHARDYGFLAANLFGRDAMGKGEPSKIAVAPGTRFRLRYGVLAHSGKVLQGDDLDAAYADYLDVTQHGAE